MEKLGKKNPQVEDIMVNTTFVMADAIDILIRNAEKRFKHFRPTTLEEFTQNKLYEL